MGEFEPNLQQIRPEEVFLRCAEYHFGQILVDTFIQFTDPESWETEAMGKNRLSIRGRPKIKFEGSKKFSLVLCEDVEYDYTIHRGGNPEKEDLVLRVKESRESSGNVDRATVSAMPNPVVWSAGWGHKFVKELRLDVPRPLYFPSESSRWILFMLHFCSLRALGGNELPEYYWENKD